MQQTAVPLMDIPADKKQVKLFTVRYKSRKSFHQFLHSKEAAQHMQFQVRSTSLRLVDCRTVDMSTSTWPG